MHELILEQRDGSDSVCGIFLDFAKASDCIDHQKRLNKLQRYGVRGNIPKLLDSHLTFRFQCILNNDEQISLNLLPISVGAPQDSVLEPFLFLVYNNDLPNSCNSQMILNADDSAIIFTAKDVQNLKDKRKMNFAQLKTGLN